MFKAAEKVAITVKKRSSCFAWGVEGEGWVGGDTHGNLKM